MAHDKHPLKNIGAEWAAPSPVKRVTIVIEMEDGSEARVITVEKEPGFELYMPFTMRRGVEKDGDTMMANGEVDLELNVYKRKKA